MTTQQQQQRHADPMPFEALETDPTVLPAPPARRPVRLLAGADVEDMDLAGRRVLDVCSYLGGWGLRAAAMGASEVVCVDVSAHAVERIRRNIARNGLGDRVTAVKADAFDELKRLREVRERFDVVILDPPAFVKRKKDFAEGRIAYRRLNEMGMQVLSRDGILVTCSCSYHVGEELFLDMLAEAARDAGRAVQIVEKRAQSRDHPILLTVPETYYLKCIVARVMD